ncbi:hypothetical protein CC86DRAFT_6011 [Ophiobolus disseminans]|uniref:Uncharacterized protein n=1 Tax=Ophiobolus disseminans TaxID=1469910 RepID=A0A6A7AJ83_9PLEO|nr:hypothetical protein CC86DRAFT_6011 [Ophiobolus disseminans]
MHQLSCLYLPTVCVCNLAAYAPTVVELSGSIAHVEAKLYVKHLDVRLRNKHHLPRLRTRTPKYFGLLSKVCEILECETSSFGRGQADATASIWRLLDEAPVDDVQIVLKHCYDSVLRSRNKPSLFVSGLRHLPSVFFVFVPHCCR